jgi:hypothetical protein
MQIFRRNYECKYLGSILCNLVISLFAPFNLIPCSFNLSVMEINQLVNLGTIYLYLITISIGREESQQCQDERGGQLHTHPGYTMGNDPHAEEEVDSYYQTCGQLEHMFMLVSCCIKKWSADPVILLCLALWPCLPNETQPRGSYGVGI